MMTLEEKNEELTKAIIEIVSIFNLKKKHIKIIFEETHYMKNRYSGQEGPECGENELLYWLAHVEIEQFIN